MARGQRDTHSRDQDFEYTFAEDYGDATKYFVLAGFEDIDEVYSLESKIEKLGGMFFFSASAASWGYSKGLANFWSWL